MRATLTPQKISSTPDDDVRQHGRSRAPAAPAPRRPGRGRCRRTPTTAITTASSGRRRAAASTPQQQRRRGPARPTSTAKPLTMTGSARPRNSGIRRAGLDQQQAEGLAWRSPPIVLPIANRHGIAAYWIALPIRKNASSPTPASRPMKAKNRIWKTGVDDERRDRGSTGSASRTARDSCVSPPMKKIRSDGRVMSAPAWRGARAESTSRRATSVPTAA